MIFIILIHALFDLTIHHCLFNHFYHMHINCIFNSTFHIHYQNFHQLISFDCVFIEITLNVDEQEHPIYHLYQNLNFNHHLSFILQDNHWLHNLLYQSLGCQNHLNHHFHCHCAIATVPSECTCSAGHRPLDCSSLILTSKE